MRFFKSALKPILVLILLSSHYDHKNFPILTQIRWTLGVNVKVQLIN